MSGTPKTATPTPEAVSPERWSHESCIASVRLSSIERTSSAALSNSCRSGMLSYSARASACAPSRSSTAAAAGASTCSRRLTHASAIPCASVALSAVHSVESLETIDERLATPSETICSSAHATDMLPPVPYAFASSLTEAMNGSSDCTNSSVSLRVASIAVSTSRIFSSSTSSEACAVHMASWAPLATCATHMMPTRHAATTPAPQNEQHPPASPRSLLPAGLLGAQHLCAQHREIQSGSSTTSTRPASTTPGPMMFCRPSP